MSDQKFYQTKMKEYADLLLKCELSQEYIKSKCYQVYGGKVGLIYISEYLNSLFSQGK